MMFELLAVLVALGPTDLTATPNGRRLAVLDAGVLLEERQARVIQRLHAVLDRAGLAEDGAIERTRGTRTIKVSVDDLEYNDIAYLKKQGGLADHASQEERDAIDVCEAAKRVRDAIAHMRPPTPDAIRALTTKMDALLQR